MTEQEIVKRIEDMFESQLDSHDMHEALEQLQVDLIGQEALDAMRAVAFKAYQDAHPWLYPEIYGPVKNPRPARLLTAKEISTELLNFLQKQMQTADFKRGKS